MSHQPPYQARPPGYGYAPDPPGTVGSLVWSIIGVTVLPIIGSIIAIVMGGNARARAAAMGRSEPGMARAGRIIGWVGLLLVAGPLLLALAAIVAAGAFTVL